MSYELTRHYSRPLLRPLAPPVGYKSQTRHSNALRGNRQSPSTSHLWVATTHTFVGTLDRDEHSAWPPAKFNENPESIPDDSIHSIPYNPESAKHHGPESKDGVYNMFAEGGLETPGFESTVPPPTIVVKRYTPNVSKAVQKATSHKLTLLVLPGMGAPKEVFEPMIDQIINTAKPGTIAEIWAVDMPFSGETALANSIGYIYGNEKDIARDLLLFVTSYLPLHAGENLPSQLDLRLPNGAQQQQTRQDLHVIGHSLGAQSAMLMAAHAPNLFTSLTVMDPAIIPSKIAKSFAAIPKHAFCLGLKDEYPNREAFEAEVRKSRRTRGWDERVIKAFVERAATESTDELVRLVSHPRLEWALYYDRETPTQSYDRLVDLKVPLNAIMPRRPFAVPAKMFESDIIQLKQRKQLTWIEKTTHQLALEKTDECAVVISKWLDSFQSSYVSKL